MNESSPWLALWGVSASLSWCYIVERQNSVAILIDLSHITAYNAVHLSITYITTDIPDCTQQALRVLYISNIYFFKWTSPSFIL